MVDPSLPFHPKSQFVEQNWRPDTSLGTIHPWAPRKGRTPSYQHQVTLEIGYRDEPDPQRFVPFSDRQWQSDRLLVSIPDMIRRLLQSGDSPILLIIKPYRGPSGTDHRWCPGGGQPQRFRWGTTSRKLDARFHTACPTKCRRNEAAARCK